jgi:hypothetical protein
LLNRSWCLTWPCLLGHVVDALKVPIDGKDALSAAGKWHVEVKALEIIALKFLHEPMQIGLKAVNSLIPISCVLYINYCIETSGLCAMHISESIMAHHFHVLTHYPTPMKLVKWWQKGFYVHLIISQPTLKEPTPDSCQCRKLMPPRPSQNIFAFCTTSFWEDVTDICWSSGNL